MSEVSETFLEEIKQALEHLYDVPFLQQHPLAQALPNQSGESSAQRLRRALIAAIETLNPGVEVYFRSPHARLYNLLHLHYVEGMTIQEVANELSISQRQAYRDLRRGQESVAALLWASHAPSPPPNATGRAAELSSMESEVARLESRISEVEMVGIVEAAVKAVERLAQQHEIALDVRFPATPLLLSTDRIMAQQVLVNLLSLVIQRAQAGTVALHLFNGESTAVTVRYRCQDSALITPIVQELIRRLGWRLVHKLDGDGGYVITLHMATGAPIILIIDDNEGLVELLDRYLTGHTCKVISANSGATGLALAESTNPDAIILDIMMPEMDGWELLQRLRANPAIENTPVIICSVFNDPELAYSLGATLFMPKPVSRDVILSALQKLGVV